MIRRRIRVGFILLLCAVLFFGCTQKSTSVPAEVQEIGLVLDIDPICLDAQIATEQSALIVINQVLEGLVRLDENGRAMPALAESWEISEDGRTYTFRLRDAQWSDGSKITADDIAYSFKRVLNYSFDSPYTYQLYPIQYAFEAKNGEDRNGIKTTKTIDDVGITAADENTLIITLEEPASYFLQLLANPAFIPAKRSFVEEFGNDYALLKENMACSGPFIVAEWVEDEYIVLEKNEYYWDSENVKLTKITCPIQMKNNEAVKMFESGEVQLITLSQSYVGQFAGGENYVQVTQPLTWYLQFNCEHEYLSNVNLRTAFAMAVDKEAFIADVRKGFGVVAQTLTPKSMSVDGVYLFDEAEHDVATFDVEGAQAKLVEALGELNITKEDLNASITILGGQGSAYESILVFLAEQININLGLNIEVEKVTYAERIGRYESGEYAITYAGMQNYYADPVCNLRSLAAGASNNFTKFSNGDYDALIEAILNTKPPFGEEADEARGQLYVDAEAIIAEQVPLYPLYSPVDAYVVDLKLKDVLFQPAQTNVDLRYAWLSQ